MISPGTGGAERGGETESEAERGGRKRVYIFPTRDIPLPTNRLPRQNPALTSPHWARPISQDMSSLFVPCGLSTCGSVGQGTWACEVIHRHSHPLSTFWEAVLGKYTNSKDGVYLPVTTPVLDHKPEEPTVITWGEGQDAYMGTHTHTHTHPSQETLALIQTPKLSWTA
jgi:hypothetical protein